MARSRSARRCGRCLAAGRRRQLPGRNGLIAFVDRSPAAIYTVSPSGGAVRLLVNGSEVAPPGAVNPQLRTPSYSRSGRQIVFVAAWRREPPSVTSEYHLFRMRADGTGLRQLTNTRNAEDAEPAFSPNGRLIVFSRDITKAKAGDDDLYRMRSDGTRVRQLTRTRGNRELSPTFAPNGRFILFASRRGIETIRLDGSNRRVIISNSRTFNYQPDIAPSGRLIVFLSNRDNGPDIYTARLNGSKVRQLTRHPGRPPHDCSNVRCPGAPVFSPDGKRIAYMNFSATGSALRKIGTSGSPRALIDTHGVSAYDPAWQPRH